MLDKSKDQKKTHETKAFLALLVKNDGESLENDNAGAGSGMKRPLSLKQMALLHQHRASLNSQA